MPSRQANAAIAGIVVFGCAVVVPIGITDPFHWRCDRASESLGPPVSLTSTEVALTGVTDSQYGIAYPTGYRPPESDHPKVVRRFQLAVVNGHHVARFIAIHTGHANITALPVAAGPTLHAKITVSCHER